MNHRAYIGAIPSCFAIVLSLTASARAEESAAAGPQLQTIVVESTAIPGTKIDIDKIPGNVQVLSAADLTREGSANLTGALNSNLSSVNINDDLQRAVTVELGINSGAFGFYVAGRALDWDGWRWFSNDRMRDLRTRTRTRSATFKSNRATTCPAYPITA